MNEVARWSLLALRRCFRSVSGAGAQAQQGAASDMTFFLTSVGPGNGADLGGLSGADAHCQQLAEAVGAGDRTWRAYLSTQASGGEPAANARDRIGQGPWQNAKGVVIAQDLAELHGDNDLNKDTALSERGEVVNGRGDTPNRHDILTGSQPDGTAFAERGGPDLRQLDRQRSRRRRHGRPSRSARAARRCGVEILEFVASVAGRLQPGGAARHRRRRPVLLLRDGLRPGPQSLDPWRLLLSPPARRGGPEPDAPVEPGHDRKCTDPTGHYFVCLVREAGGRCRAAVGLARGSDRAPGPAPGGCPTNDPTRRLDRCSALPGQAAPRKSRLPIGTPQWRRIAYAAVVWK